MDIFQAPNDELPPAPDDMDDYDWGNLEINSDNPLDPSGIHIERVVWMGTGLHMWIDEFGYFKTYESFKDLMALRCSCSPGTVKRSLKKLALWRKGRKGRAGGPQLRRMQKEIVRFTLRQFRGDSE